MLGREVLRQHRASSAPLRLDPDQPLVRFRCQARLRLSCVLLFLPLLIPLMAIVGLAVRLTSRGPVFFVQSRMGRHGKTFHILKFRTMVHIREKKHHAVTTAVNQRFTLVGPFLRRWKLDELPQLLNVLVGHMSLVGPRPKLPEHVVANLPCRPRNYWRRHACFAREEAMLGRHPAASGERLLSHPRSSG